MPSPKLRHQYVFFAIVVNLFSFLTAANVDIVFVFAKKTKKNYLFWQAKVGGNPCV
jgi:hypothetical protein